MEVEDPIDSYEKAMSYLEKYLQKKNEVILDFRIYLTLKDSDFVCLHNKKQIDLKR